MNEPVIHSEVLNHPTYPRGDVPKANLSYRVLTFLLSL